MSSILVYHYISHVLNNKLLVRDSSHDLINEPFDNRTTLDHSHTELVRYSDPHCTIDSDFYAMASIAC